MNEPAETAKEGLIAMNEHDVGYEVAGPKQETENHRIL